jgi:hypothetical protein
VTRMRRPPDVEGAAPRRQGSGHHHHTDTATATAASCLPRRVATLAGFGDDQSDGVPPAPPPVFDNYPEARRAMLERAGCPRLYLDKADQLLEVWLTPRFFRGRWVVAGYGAEAAHRVVQLLTTRRAGAR